jgi:hypothetical protein
MAFLKMVVQGILVPAKEKYFVRGGSDLKKYGSNPVMKSEDPKDRQVMYSRISPVSLNQSFFLLRHCYLSSYGNTVQNFIFAKVKKSGGTEKINDAS